MRQLVRGITLGILMTFMFLQFHLPIYAQSPLNAGIVKGIWFSTADIKAEHPLKIYVAVHNQEQYFLKGTITFLDNSSIISTKNFVVGPQQITVLSTTWTPSQGSHKITVRLDSTYLCTDETLLLNCTKVSLGQYTVANTVVQTKKKKKPSITLTPFQDIPDNHSNTSLSETPIKNQVRISTITKTTKVVGPLKTSVEKVIEIDGKIRDFTKRLLVSPSDSQVSGGANQSRLSKRVLINVLNLPGLGLVIPIFVLYGIQRFRRKKDKENH